MNKAVERAIAANLNLSIAQSAIEAGKGDLEQAGLLPNPELSIEAENAFGSGAYTGLKEADLTAAVSQKIELGGKREIRMRRARAANEGARLHRDLVVRDLEVKTKKAFVRLLAAQREVDLASRAAKEMKNAARALREKVSKGASPEADSNRGELALELSGIRLQRAQSGLIIARQALLTLWNEDGYRKLKATGSLALASTNLPGLGELLKKVDAHPILGVEKAKVEEGSAAYALEKSRAVPDPTIGVGARHFNGIDESAFLISLSIPIPVADANQGNIRAAGARTNAARLSVRQTQLVLSERLRKAYQEYQSSCLEAKRFRNTVLPAARDSARSIRKGYRLGRFGVLDLLGALQVEIDSAQQAVEAVLSCRLSLIEIEGLTGDTYQSAASEMSREGEKS
ncbi:cobalt-zinc-cadmium efflux system outer membrane protein [Parvibaculum indicum]|uniref:TolC family protein n=2 Tax=Hyphomicrobiales TaxID=356 RepID=UPI0014228CA1|nr:MULTISPECIES: TolC family protein [Parvibaculum]NIJ43384.1 cobalt-zinc-cadmium efflux system outer membrane protein [Parvibaculum indicum]